MSLHRRCFCVSATVFPVCLNFRVLWQCHNSDLHHAFSPLSSAGLILYRSSTSIMSFFQNSSGVDARWSTSIAVGRDQHNHNHNYHFGGQIVHRGKEPKNHSFIFDLNALQCICLDLNHFFDKVAHDAAYNCRGPRSRCLQGTREILIARIMEWVNGPSDRQICWLNGPAGFGKSAVAQTIAELCADAGTLAASFFFFRGAGSRSRITSFITTLAYQLSISIPAVRVPLQELLQRDPSIPHQSLENQFRKLIVEPILTLREPIRRMVIVCDALDECDDKDEVADFIEIITRTSQLPFLFLFTSRVEEHIQKKFETLAAQSAIHLLRLEDFNANADIRTFIRSRFSTIREENHRVMRHIPQPWPSSHDLEEIVGKASGSFIFADTFINFVNDGSDLPHRKLRIALQTHAGLDPLYHQVLSAAPRDRYFQRIIGTIMLLKHNLPIADIACLVRLETADVLHFLLGIQSILAIPEDDTHPVRLLHTSLRDYLVTRQRSQIFFINPPTRHLFIATNCLAVIAEHPEPDFFDSDRLKYASLNWCHHLDCCIKEGGGQSLLDPQSYDYVVKCLTDFRSHSFDSWVNTAILFNSATEIVNTLKSMVSGLHVCRMWLM